MGGDHTYVQIQSALISACSKASTTQLIGYQAERPHGLVTYAAGRGYVHQSDLYHISLCDERAVWHDPLSNGADAAAACNLYSRSSCPERTGGRVPFSAEPSPCIAQPQEGAVYVSECSLNSISPSLL